MRTAKAPRISPARTPSTDVQAPQRPKTLAERDASEFMEATYVPCAPKVAPDQAAGELTAKAGSPRPPGRRAPTSGRKAKQAKAKAGTAHKGKNAKTGGKPAPSAKPDKAPKRLSCLDAAVQVLSASKEPMKAGEMIAAMAKKGLWSSPKGKTPEASLNAAIIREISGKGKESRFVKTGRGMFAVTKHHKP